MLIKYILTTIYTTNLFRIKSCLEDILDTLIFNFQYQRTVSINNNKFYILTSFYYL